MALGAGLNYAVKFNTSWLGQITSQNFTAGVEKYVETGSGVFDPPFLAIIAQNPMMTFATRALSTAFGLIGLDGMALTASNVATMFSKPAAQGGMLAAGSVWTSIAVAGGLIVPRSLEVQQGGPATLSYELHVVDVLGNGSVPITRTVGSVAAPSGTANHDELFTAGPVLFDTTQILGVQSVRVDFGIQVSKFGADGSIYPRFAAITQRQPTITVALKDPAALSSVPQAGLSLSAGATIKFLQCNAHGTIVSLDGVSLSVAQGMAYTNSFGGQAGQLQDNEFMICPTHNGTDSILAIDTFSA